MVVQRERELSGNGNFSVEKMKLPREHGQSALKSLCKSDGNITHKFVSARVFVNN